jgi:tetratricopeptide (TPR) repeat protein
VECGQTDLAKVIQMVEHLLESQDYQKAMDLCQSIRMQDPLPRKFWFCLARALEGLGNSHGALEAYRSEIAQLKRVPPDILGQIGVLLVKVGRYREGAVCLSESCEISPSPDRLILLASAYSKLNRREQAREVLRRVLDVDPDNDEAWNNLGACSLETPEQAERAFLRALKIDVNRSNSYGGLAQVYLDQGRIEEAVRVAGEGLKRNPFEGICHLVIGDARERLGDWDGAEEAYLKALRCDRGKQDALLALAGVFERRARIAEALDWHIRGLHAWPDDARIRDAYLRFADAHDCSEPALVELCRRCDLLQA